MCDTENVTRFHPRYPSFEECVAFHGHACPGLATGYRVATAAMRTLGVARPYDEELVCVAETDACGVDAIQVVTGCTAGKGNLIMRDYGKHAFSFFSREGQHAIRIIVSRGNMPGQSEMDTLRKKVFSGTADPGEQARFKDLMQATLERILVAPEHEILTIQEIQDKPPRKARIFKSVTCARCGESVADARTRVVDGSRVCIPCAEATPRKQQ